MSHDIPLERRKRVSSAGPRTVDGVLNVVDDAVADQHFQNLAAQLHYLLIFGHLVQRPKQLQPGNEKSPKRVGREKVSVLMCKQKNWTVI